MQAKGETNQPQPVLRMTTYTITNDRYSNQPDQVNFDQLVEMCNELSWSVDLYERGGKVYDRKNGEVVAEQVSSFDADEQQDQPQEATTMNGSQIINFNQKVANYVNDNATYIKESYTEGEETIAEAALRHYQDSAEGYGETLLNEEEQAQFLANVNHAINDENGFFLSGGSISETLKDYED